MKNLLLLLLCLNCGMLSAETYSVDARITPSIPLSGHLKMGNPGPAGQEILANSKYLTLGGKPFIPVMGEIHFSRVPKAEWEDRILKMKAAGITVIATYVFWIHHEETEGQFDWSGDRDFRSFVQLCQKHHLFVYPRIGPWCHGEVRNGGTPDWVFGKKGLVDRSNNPVYQALASRLYHEVAKQMEGLYYKDGGPIIGIQLENEYRRGPGGNAHILWLKQTARECGMDVPLYTVTGWGNASIPQDEVIPLFGDYPEEPWQTDLVPNRNNPAFTFEAPKNSAGIGADLAGKEGKSTVDLTRYPFLTCEIGVGNQISYHRRPILDRLDGLAIATIKTGCGSNLPGYYVFAGGSNPVGKYNTMEENQDETGYWNQYCDISYDFQASISETGELASSYYQIKKLHYFLNAFGNRLAPMSPVVPASQDPLQKLQWSVRVQGNSGFVFGMNYFRNNRKPVQKDVRFSLDLPDGKLMFPSQGVDIPDSCLFIWPFRFDLNGLQLNYATAQPMCQANPDRWFFIQSHGVTPEFCFPAGQIRSISAKGCDIRRTDEQLIIRMPDPDLSRPVRIRRTDGKELTLTVLSEQQADQAWVFDEKGQKEVYVSNANLYRKGAELHLFGVKNSFSLTQLAGPEFKPAKGWKSTRQGGSMTWHINLPERRIQANVTRETTLEGAQWLKSGVQVITPKNQLYHRVFCKTINLEDSSAIRTATFLLQTAQACRIRVNDKWLNQTIRTKGLDTLDLTGYLHDGGNILLLDFPFEQGDLAFAARLTVERFNADCSEYVTDESWTVADLYTLPVNNAVIKGGKKPEILPSPVTADSTSTWKLSIPANCLDGLENAYLHLDCAGDMGRCYREGRLVADQFFHGIRWSIELKKFSGTAPFRIELTPLGPNARILFDDKVLAKKGEDARLRSVRVIPEYKTSLLLKD